MVHIGQNDAALSKRHNRSVVTQFGGDKIGMLAKHRRTHSGNI
jgi:hypothetical protein